MQYSPYDMIDRLIAEYEQDTHSIRGEKMIMEMYPKLLVMTIASHFEKNIKDRISDYIVRPKSGYPSLGRKMNADSAYKLFYTLDKSGNVHFDASKFYDLFNVNFKKETRNRFNALRKEYIDDFSKQADIIKDSTLAEVEALYARLIDIKEKLENCDFKRAETAFLELKLRRNRVAHNFLCTLSDSFQDICAFYYDAMLYAKAVEDELRHRTEAADLTARETV